MTHMFGLKQKEKNNIYLKFAKARKRKTFMLDVLGCKSINT